MFVQKQTEIEIPTRGKGLVEVTGPISRWVDGQRITLGQLTIFIRHTSASLVIQENADGDVQRDLEYFFSKLVRDDDPGFLHTTEGPDDMPAHVRSALTQTTLTIPVANGKPVLGTWQGIYVYEHRTRPHSRRLTLHLIGEQTT